MKKIYKYSIFITDQFTLSLPKGYKILKIDIQNSMPSLWALVDSDKVVELEDCKFYVFGTGNKLPDDVDQLIYIDSFQMSNGKLVWHLFQDRRNEEKTPWSK